MKVLTFKYFFTVLRPFPSCSNIFFLSEAEWEVIDVKMILYFHANKTYFHKKGFALSLVYRVRVFVTRKWSVTVYTSTSLLLS